MKRLVICLVAVSICAWAVPACSKKKSPTGKTIWLKRIEKIREKACRCPDNNCAIEVWKEYQRWITDGSGKEPVRDAAQIKKQMRLVDRCLGKWPGDPNALRFGPPRNKNMPPK